MSKPERLMKMFIKCLVSPRGINYFNLRIPDFHKVNRYGKLQLFFSENSTVLWASRYIFVYIHNNYNEKTIFTFSAPFHMGQTNMMHQNVQLDVVG